MNRGEDGWVTQIRKGVLELCVFAIVDREESYGYQIVERLGSLPGLEVTESTVYPLLARLAHEGWFAVRVRKSESGPPRRYYRLTKQGLSRFQQLVQTWNVVCGSIDQLIGNTPSRESFQRENAQ